MAATGPVRIQRAALIVNTRARRAGASFTRARALLTAAGMPLVAAEALHDAARLRATVRAALDDGCDLIILGGGDGSLSAVVDDLAHHHATLGLLPLGTANDFARTLAIPTDLDAACATITRGAVAAVDLGLAGDTYFINVVSVGLGAAVIPAESPTLKRLAGALAYPVAVARALRRVRPFAATLTFPNGDYPAATFPRLLQVGVGNGRFYGGGLVVAPQAGLDEGLLDAYALAWGSWRDLLGVARSFKSGAFVHRPDVHHYRTAHVHIATQPLLPINMDGELVGRTPTHVAVAPGALRVLVPHAAPAAARRGQGRLAPR
jgi:YegS/Rv2252/BmrU family lipid kinase